MTRQAAVLGFTFILVDSHSPDQDLGSLPSGPGRVYREAPLRLSTLPLKNAVSLKEEHVGFLAMQVFGRELASVFTELGKRQQSIALVQTCGFKNKPNRRIQLYIQSLPAMSRGAPRWGQCRAFIQK